MYKKIIASEFGKDMKSSAWQELVKNCPVWWKAKEVKTYDLQNLQLSPEKRKLITLYFTGSRKIKRGKLARYKIIITNNSAVIKKNLKINRIIPSGMGYKRKSKGLAVSNKIANLKAGDKKILSFSLLGVRAGKYKVVAKLFVDKILITRTITTQVKKPWREEFTYLRKNTYSCGGQAHTVKEYRHHKTGMEFVLIPAGSFMMGADNKTDYEKPAHRVTISKPFLMSKTEVTQKVWQKIMGNNPSGGGRGKGDNKPVNAVSWYKAQEFCEKVGLNLPTEAQWEYACRAGTTTDFYWGNGESDTKKYGWYGNNSGGYMRDVAQKKNNAFGLYDMSGNASEMCQDWYDSYSSGAQIDPTGPSTGSKIVTRGGNIDAWIPRQLRSSSRFGDNSAVNEGYESLGFRVSRQVSK